MKRIQNRPIIGRLPLQEFTTNVNEGIPNPEKRRLSTFDRCAALGGKPYFTCWLV